MEKLIFDPSNAKDFVSAEEISSIEKEICAARDVLVNGTGAGNDFIGWVNLPIEYDKEEFERIKAAAKKIKEESEVLLVIGIGGSYLGARSAVEFLKGIYHNQVPGNNPEIYYVGNNLSSDYISDIEKIIGDRDFSINVISKSGTTTEPAIAFRLFKEKLIKKYGEKEAANRIYATTDKARGALKTQADEEGYETFVVPDDIGGRYSVLTAVGLLPIAVSGVDVDALMEGAAFARECALNDPFEKNASLSYVAYRNVLYKKGKSIEILACYEPAIQYITEWWKQLYGESEGKDQKGLYPASINLTADLHSMGQFIQDGTRNMFETVLFVDSSHNKIVLGEEKTDLDGLNYLSGKDMDFVNSSAMKGTMKAHISGGVPNLLISMPKRDEYSLGQLFYFFEFACGVSGYTLGVNPFNQPGVESYKKNMFELLGKPGY